MTDDAQKLRWRCRRGMRELDAILINFVSISYDSLADDDKVRFGALLELPDPELHACLVGRHVPTDPLLERLLDRIRTDFHG
tara:strand:+ start:134 stop:379 length:246 start_codon:yes stop_codon:yes gene_type:complete